MRKLARITGSLVALALSLTGTARATVPGDANADGTVSVADGVQILRAAGGLSSSCDLPTCDIDGGGFITVTDGVGALRIVGGLPATPQPAAPIPGSAAPVDVRFQLESTAALQGYHLEITYPLAAGGFAGSADAVQCTSSGSGAFVVNDRDDGTMAVIQAHIAALTFPLVVTCRFEQANGATLQPSDLGVTVVEVVENGAAGDVGDLAVTVTLAIPTLSICDAEELRLTTTAGGIIDPGWTGTYHASPLPADATLAIPLACDAATCTVAGNALAGATAGPPIPLAAGGVALCVLNSFRDAPTGTVDCGSGCTTIDAPLLSLVFLTLSTDEPCPTCVGDPVPNDGAKGGTCNGGTSPDAPCDAGATGGGRFATSADCRPLGSSVGELEIDLDPLTTGTVVAAPSRTCLSGAFPGTQCHCPNQVQPNACNGGDCAPTGFCAQGPLDGVCSGDAFRPCRPEEGSGDCDDAYPGAGTCVTEPRRCFPSEITRTGTCGEEATLVSVFCAPPTRAPAINTTMGLPGPAALSLPVRLSPAPTNPPPAPGCAPAPLAACRGISPRKSSSLLLRQRSAKSRELAWRWLGGDATAASDFGNPAIDTDYALCVYAPDLVVQAQVPAAGLCKGKPCWKPTRKGFVYRDVAGVQDGVTRIELVSGASGKARIVVKGGGPNLTLPALPLGAPPVVQLQSETGACWQSTFTTSDVGRNEPKRFRAARP